MNTDRLAQIEDEYRRIMRISSSSSVRADAQDVLALVEIAKQARTLTGQPFGQLSQREFYKLREEVARLDRPSSDGTADSGAAEGDA